MTKSELIERIVTHQGQLSAKDVELAIKTMLEQMSQALATGDRIEIRGFGSFSLHYRAPRVGRNPKTGESVRLDGKFVPHFAGQGVAGSGQRAGVISALFRCWSCHALGQAYVNGGGAVSCRPFHDCGCFGEPAKRQL